MADNFRCVIHGSFSKHFSEIKRTADIFSSAGIEVLAPGAGEIVGETDGFVLLEGEQENDPRLIELLYLHNLRRLGPNGFSYFVNPDGYIGRSASYELGIAQLTNTRCFFSHKPVDHPAYFMGGSVRPAEVLAEYISTHQKLPAPRVRQNEKHIDKLWQQLMVPGSVVAAGAIIEYRPESDKKEKEVLLVKTHKWGGRYSIVGGKVRRNERLHDALIREVKEETRLQGQVGPHICTFDQIRNSGYYQEGMQHIFVDNVVRVKSKNVTLNDEAQDYVWALPSEALEHLDIEPNARTTLLTYTKFAGNLPH